MRLLPYQRAAYLMQRDIDKHHRHLQIHNNIYVADRARRGVIFMVEQQRHLRQLGH